MYKEALEVSEGVRCQAPVFRSKVNVFFLNTTPKGRILAIL